MFQCIIKTSNYENFELIIINDGSNNGVPYFELLKKSKLKMIKYFGFEKNRGINICCEFGLNNYSGEIVIFVDADDQVKSNCLDLINYYYEKYNFDLMFFSKATFMMNNSSLEISYISNFFNNNFFGRLSEFNIYRNIENFLFTKKEFFVNKNNKFSFEDLLLLSVASKSSSLHCKVYTKEILDNIKKRKETFFCEKFLYKNHDFKLSYYSTFFCKRFLLVNDGYYIYYVGSNSSVTKNDSKFTNKEVFNSWINFFKISYEKEKDESMFKNKILFILFLNLYSIHISSREIKLIISRNKLLKFFFKLIKKIYKSNIINLQIYKEFKKMYKLKTNIFFNYLKPILNFIALKIKKFMNI